MQADQGLFSDAFDRNIVLAVDSPNYDTYRKRIANQRKNQTYVMFEAIKKASNIEDGLGSSYYGIGQ